MTATAFVRCLAIGLPSPNHDAMAGAAYPVSEPIHSAALAAFAVALLCGALMPSTLFPHLGCYERGRYLLPAIGAFGVLFWWAITAIVPTRWHRPLIATILALLIALNLCCAINLHTFLNPLYAPR